VAAEGHGRVPAPGNLGDGLVSAPRCGLGLRPGHTLAEQTGDRGVALGAFEPAASRGLGARMPSACRRRRSSSSLRAIAARISSIMALMAANIQLVNS